MVPYNRITQLGQGTFGTVFLCERMYNKLQIVVKEINTDLESDQLKAAKNEVQILKSFSHPNIIQYLDSFYKKNIFYIVMEYARHGNLYEYIKQSKPELIRKKTVLKLFCQILMGLDQIHSKKIIHRDLKCENILLTGAKGDIVKIGDFGISRILHPESMANTVIGTTNYLAPEMCDGRPYDTKSDIWSLGCILFEMCALERMFDGSVSKVVLSIKNGHRKLIKIDKYGLEIQQLIENMLQENSENRPSTTNLSVYPQILPTLQCLSLDLMF